MVDSIICAAIGIICPHCQEHRHIQAAVDRFQTRLHFQRAEFDLEPLMFNEALLLTISPGLHGNIHGIQH
jgi:hypothetical protein